MYGLEMGKVKNATLDGWHAWCLSEVMGIGRCTKEEGYTGGELNSACVWPYGPITTNKLGHKLERRMRRVCTGRYTAWKTMQMLSKRALLAGNGRTNLHVLTTKYTPKVVKGDTRMTQRTIGEMK